jgi:hypothetical protein
VTRVLQRRWRSGPPKRDKEQLGDGAIGGLPLSSLSSSICEIWRVMTYRAGQGRRLRAIVIAACGDSAINPCRPFFRSGLAATPTGGATGVLGLFTMRQNVCI